MHSLCITLFFCHNHGSHNSLNPKGVFVLNTFRKFYADISASFEIGAVVLLILLQIWAFVGHSDIPAYCAGTLVVLSWIAKKNNPASLGLAPPWITIPLSAAASVFLVLFRPPLHEYFPALYGPPKIAVHFVAYVPWAIAQKVIENGLILERLLERKIAPHVAT